MDIQRYLLDALEGLFDKVGSECFDITPTTFTFACEAEAMTLTDTTSVFDRVDVTEFTRDFHLIRATTQHLYPVHLRGPRSRTPGTLNGASLKRSQVEMSTWYFLLLLSL